MRVSKVVSPGSGYGQWREIGAVREWFPHLLALVAHRVTWGGSLLNFGQRKPTHVSIDKELVTESEL